MLPDVALLRIFDFYMYGTTAEGWQTLVHVCRKWRGVVFGSPSRLNLRLYCGGQTPVRKALGLDVWPPLPIVVVANNQEVRDDEGNIVAAIEHNDRICELHLFNIPRSPLANLLGTMEQRSFPALTHLVLGLGSQDQDEIAPPTVPDSFLDGSAQSLQMVWLDRIPFPGLPKLLLSATNLVTLRLSNIPHSGYFSPEAIVSCISTLSGLASLGIEFQSPQCRPDRRNDRRRRRRPAAPQTRSVLPVLTGFVFEGVSEYLEDFVALIDAPLLHYCHIIFFHQLIFDTPQLAQFLSRTPTFNAHAHDREARVVFSHWGVRIRLQELVLQISCRQSDWQLSSLAQVCSSIVFQPLISAVERLYFLENRPLHWQDDIESSQWLELFHPFTAVKDLYLSAGLMILIEPALQEIVGERVTEVFPVLQKLFLENPLSSGPVQVQETIGQFVVGRWLAGHPVAVFSGESEVFRL